MDVIVVVSRQNLPKLYNYQYDFGADIYSHSTLLEVYLYLRVENKLTDFICAHSC